MNAFSLPPGSTVAQARRRIAARFRAEGLETPDLDARLLVGHVLALDHTALAVLPDRIVDAAALAGIESLAARRLKREPVARIVGEKEFWGLPLQLSPETLVPRPETETVVEVALSLVAEGSGADRPVRIADLGTGSGAILLALMKELPFAVGVGTDISAKALAVARANAQLHGLADRTVFVNGDYGRALAGGFDFVVSNPPYVVCTEVGGLEPEVRDYDPPRALDGGEDGLSAYRDIVADAARLLAPDGWLVLELGDAEGVSRLVRDTGMFELNPIIPDLSGLPRVLCATRGRR